MKLAVSGASGKTGYRIAEEATKQNIDLRLLTRAESVVPSSLDSIETVQTSLFNPNLLDKSLQGCDALAIATGARPGIDLTGPCKVDAKGVQNQIESCKRVGVKRVILVTSLCTGKLFHPLNLFGLILIYKRIGEKALEASGLDWTIIRPGGLNENEEGIEKKLIYYSPPNTQEEGYIPRRLVASCCIEALQTKTSIGKIIEITSQDDVKEISMQKAIECFENQVNIKEK